MCLVVFPLYLWVYDFAQTRGYVFFPTLFEERHRIVPAWHTGADIAEHGIWLSKITVLHMFGVALPEEYFYRGYLQPVLHARTSKQSVSVFGWDLSSGIVIATGYFALGHFIGEWDITRLLPFFPGLLFAYLRDKTHSLRAPIVFHGLCNIFSNVLGLFYV